MYAYAFNNYKSGKIKDALNLITKCIKLYPKNPYFHELKGQIYFESGKFIKAIDSFNISSSILPQERVLNYFLQNHFIIVIILITKKNQ